jgi:hypothetical protein
MLATVVRWNYSCRCAKAHEPSGHCVRFEVLNSGDYEECRLLGYITPLYTSQEDITSPLQIPAG